MWVHIGDWAVSTPLIIATVWCGLVALQWAYKLEKSREYGGHNVVTSRGRAVSISPFGGNKIAIVWHLLPVPERYGP